MIDRQPQGLVGKVSANCINYYTGSDVISLKKHFFLFWAKGIRLVWGRPMVLQAQRYHIAVEIYFIHGIEPCLLGGKSGY